MKSLLALVLVAAATAAQAETKIHWYGQAAFRIDTPDVMLACIGGHFVMDPVRAALAVEWVGPKAVIPMHYGTVPLLAGTPAQFKAALEKRGLGHRMIDMKPGEDRSF